MRLRDQCLTIKEFKLKLGHMIDRSQLAHHIDQWIQMVIESGVEVLELQLISGAKGHWYNVPLCLTEAKSLTKLVLSGEIRLDPAFLNHSLKFFSMKTLSLSHILFGDEGVMEHFISHCPLIEHLTLDFCYVYNSLSIGHPRTYPVKSLSLHGLQKLKGADVQGIVEVYIDAPNLENLRYRAPLHGNVSYKLNFDSCTNLKCLNLCSLWKPDKWLLELLYKIPFLESLALNKCHLSKRIDISGPQLKFFELSYCYNVKEVNIDAPNLLSCDYSEEVGEGKPAISFLRNSNQLEFNVYLAVGHWHPYSLREFLRNVKPQEFGESQSVLEVSSPLPSMKHVQLGFHMTNKADYFPLMNWLLSSCFPETISFSLKSYFKAFIVFFYEMLTDKKKRERYLRRYHRSWRHKCCWHGLKVVKVTHLERTYENVEDFKAILDALPETCVEEYVSFVLKL
ncbi:hypothetical protein PIB30_012201 [Stylosanthes scabra]|uniref:At1g61320/AtMIF1 LRR domain-containing protein n=1 Tax=Stylosanthes scabra TaxID=79078 RepID=A0ABU6U4Z8_9FABA|nr:hypothetical protein [Stylosanthes scabra]